MGALNKTAVAKCIKINSIVIFQPKPVQNIVGDIITITSQNNNNSKSQQEVEYKEKYKT